MGGKTYIPSAVFFANRLSDYLTRYQETLLAGKTEDQIAAFGDLLLCLAQFLQKWPRPPING